MAALELQIRFLDDRYHGAGEWPPDPARLFQALVHGGHVGAGSASWTEAHNAALEWLSALPPPEIEYRPTQAGRAFSIFVPNNSLDRTKQSTKTTKRVAPRLLANRIGDGPDLVYRWDTSDSDEVRAHLLALDQLAARLLALGWGIDIAAAVARLDQRPRRRGYETFAPTKRGGRSLRTLAPGLLAHLRERHEESRRRITPEGVNPYTRPTDFRLARYHRVSEGSSRRWYGFKLQRLDGESFSLPWREVPKAAAWLRHMAGEAMREEYGPEDQGWIDSYVLGHTAEHEMGVRLSYIPLPSIGHPYSDGGVRRALIVEPPEVGGRDAETLDLLRIKAPGRRLTRAGDRRPEAVMTSLAVGDGVLQRYVRTARPACSWRTATPVILHGHNAGRKGLSVRKTEKLLFQALAAAGYPAEAVRRLSFQMAPYWPGCAAAAAIMTPRHLNRWPRLHVAIDFSQPIEGPLAIGLGRHCGIGLFAAADD